MFCGWQLTFESKENDISNYRINFVECSQILYGKAKFTISIPDPIPVPSYYSIRMRYNTSWRLHRVLVRYEMAKGTEYRYGMKLHTSLVQVW